MNHRFDDFGVGSLVMWNVVVEAVEKGLGLS